jgi:YHS domain-containing protein
MWDEKNSLKFKIEFNGHNYFFAISFAGKSNNNRGRSYGVSNSLV